MSGMLAGVHEAARRRRRIFHTTSNGSHGFLPNSSMQRNFSMGQKLLYDESKLGEEAREAKKRLDQRLQHQWRSHTKRNAKLGERSSRSTGFTAALPSDSQAEPPKLGRNKLKMPKWLKTSWKLSRDEEECAVCLEQLKGKTLTELLCGHRFHARCVLPWLHENATCPCCRMEVKSS